MDIAYELAKYIADGGFGTLGTNIYAGQIASDQDGVYVQRAGGTLNNYLPIENSIVDIYCKDTSAQACVTKLSQIKHYIHRMHNTLTTSSYIYSMLVIGDVQDVDRDLEYAKIFKITVSVICRDTSLIS